MYDFETLIVITLAVLMVPFVVILLAVALAMFCLFVDAVCFAVSSFLHDIISNHRSKED